MCIYYVDREMHKTLPEKERIDCTHHFVSSSDEDGDSSRVLTLLNHQHVVLGRTKTQLSHDSSSPQLLGGQL